jgi:hypothetical protein
VAFERARPGLTADQLDGEYYADAWRFIRQHPARWLDLTARKVFYSFVPIGPSYRLHSPLYFLVSLLSCAFALPLALAGLWRLRAARRLSAAWALWLLGASVVMVSAVFFPQERFRIPVLDPTLLVCAAAWLAPLPVVTRLIDGPAAAGE